MITSSSGGYTKEAQLKHEAAFAALNEADAVHAAKIAKIESRLENHHACLSDSLASMESRLTAIEQRRIKIRFLNWLHGLRRG